MNAWYDKNKGKAWLISVLVTISFGGVAAAIFFRSNSSKVVAEKSIVGGRDVTISNLKIGEDIHDKRNLTVKRLDRAWSMAWPIVNDYSTKIRQETKIVVFKNSYMMSEKIKHLSERTIIVLDDLALAITALSRYDDTDLSRKTQMSVVNMKYTVADVQIIGVNIYIIINKFENTKFIGPLSHFKIKEDRMI